MTKYNVKVKSGFFSWTNIGNFTARNMKHMEQAVIDRIVSGSKRYEVLNERKAIFYCKRKKHVITKL